MGKGLAAIVCAVALVAGAMAWADTAWVRVTARCPDQPVVVTAQDVHVIGPVCKASAAARQQFEACHLTLKRPVNMGFSGGEKKRNEILQLLLPSQRGGTCPSSLAF